MLIFHPDQHLQSRGLKKGSFSLLLMTVLPWNGSGWPHRTPYNSNPFQFTKRTQINFHKNWMGFIPPSTLSTQSPDRNDRRKTNRRKRMVRRVRGRRGGDCMPLTITFPVFFCAHTLGKTFRAISPAHTVLHKQRQEDWEKEHNHQNGALKQEMATRTRMVRTRTNERILPSSLPQRRNSREQMPSLKNFGEWSHFLCNLLLWITQS